MPRSRPGHLAIACAVALVAGHAIANLDVPESAVPNPDAEVAVAAVKAGDWQRAIVGFSAALKAEPDNADFHNGLGYAYRKAGRFDDSFRHYRQALGLNPGLKSAHEYIGEAYLATGDKAKAREHLATLERLCGGRDCEEYRDLERAIAAAK
jgi:Flp pilus assembly protein TadD